MRRYLAIFPLVFAPLSIACSDGDKSDDEEEEEGGFEETSGEETSTDEEEEEEEEEEGSPDELLVYYGWTSSFAIDAETSTGSGGETFFYYEPDIYADFICTTDSAGVATPSSYACEECEFALAIALDVSTEGVNMTLDSGDSACSLLGYEFNEDGTVVDDEASSRDGIGFASYIGGYYDVAVYYFPSYGAWYPIAYSDWDGNTWEYQYAPSSFYGYVYYY